MELSLLFHVHMMYESYTSLHVLLCFSKSNDKNIAMYVGFEADGMLAGKSSLLQNIMTLFALLLRCLTQMLNVMT